ncbi:MAG: hypothetical protein V7776_21760 [Halopseudomonas aestusnigri]
MAGYNYVQMKSNNAVEAEADVLFPASYISKFIGVPTVLIKEHVYSAEYHHTSGWYNTTDYYDLKEAKEFFLSEEGKTVLTEYKNREKLGPVIHKNCKVKWLEWTGTRKKRRCHEVEAEGATVSVKRLTATITLRNGDTFTKRLTTRGFEFEN